MTPATKIVRKPLGEQVTDALRRMILEGDLPAGQRLVEEQLAEQIGTSRTPIREALHRLEQECLVRRRAKGGYQVRPMSAKEVEEVTGVRAALESYALELASKRLTPELMDKLEKNVSAFSLALEKKERKRLIELNTEFHNIIYQSAGSELLLRMINDLAVTLHRFRVSLLSDPDQAVRSLQDHQSMLAALKAGDRDRAVRVCREHLLAGGQWILQRLQEDNDQE